MTVLENWDKDRIARTAGLLYLLNVVTGIFSLAYVPSQISVSGDAATTVSNLATFESLFRLGIAAELLCFTIFLLLPFVLYKLLSPVGKSIAVLMVAFAVVQVPIAFVNLTHKLDILSLLSGTGYLHGFAAAQVQAQIMLSLAAYGSGILVSEIFWGLWLLPFGYLVFKSGFLPRVLGILLMAGCFGYLIDVFGSVLLTGYPQTFIASHFTLPAAVGEIGTCLWLLIVGVRRTKSPVVSISEPA